MKIDDVNTLFNTLFRVAIPQINNLLNDGLPIPPIKPVDLSKSGLALLDRYIRIDFNPEPSKEGMKEFAPIIANKLIESYRKVQSVHAVRRSRPEKLPQWLKIEY